MPTKLSFTQTNDSTTFIPNAIGKFSIFCELARRRMRNRLKGKSADLEASLPINESMRPTLMGATSEKFLDSMHDYITQNSDGLLMEASAKHLSPSGGYIVVK